MAGNYFKEIPEAILALSAILDRYSWISIDEVTTFAPVYYPVAIIEMDLEEQSFEDFESIQLGVLRFVDIGITDPNIISLSMGINNVVYIDNILKLLQSYGHIDRDGITELGKDSLAQQKKITLTRVKQQFQMDALNGNLIKVDQSLNTSTILTKDETFRNIGHLNYLDGIPAYKVQKEIQSIGFNHYKKYRSTVLNINVQEIHDITCVDVEYVKGYLMELRSVDTPIIFGKRTNLSSDRNFEYFWMPFSYDDSNLLLAKHFENQDIVQNTSQATEYINELSSLIYDRADWIDDILEVVKKTIHSWNASLHLSDRQIYCFDVDESRIAVVNLFPENFTKFNKPIANLFDMYFKYGEFVITGPNLFGQLISIKTKDPTVLNVIQAYGELKNHLKRNEIVDKTKSHLSENSLENLEGKKLLDSIYEYWRDLLAKIS